MAKTTMFKHTCPATKLIEPFNQRDLITSGAHP
jgi:hypothetical protein